MSGRDGADDSRTPWQADRDRAESPGRWPQESWGPFHRHFANDAVHRDGHPECDQPGTPRRVYVFDPYALDEHELIVARYAIAHPEQFAPQEDGQVTVRAADLRAFLEAVDTDYVSTENLPGLEERIGRLAAAVGLGDDETAAATGLDWTAATGKFWLVITRKDGTEDKGYPVIKADGSWTYYVPAGVRLVGTSAVEPGDTVSGKLEMSDW